MKTLKINRIKYLYFILLTSLLTVVPFVAKSQLIEYRDPSFGYLVATNNTRMVFTIAETDTTVKLRVMMIGPSYIWVAASHITYNADVLMVTDKTYTDDVEYYSANKTFYCVDLSPRCAAEYPKFQPAIAGVGDLQPGGMPAGGKYFLNDFTSTYIGPFRIAECIPFTAGELYPTFNMYFKKKNPGVNITKEDFGFLADRQFGFDRQTFWGISPLTIFIDTALNPLLKREYLPELFVYRSPSNVKTNPVTNLDFASATLNANYTRGYLHPANDMYISSRTSCKHTGRLDWDTVSHYGFIYATTSADLSVNDVSKLITINGTEYPFPTSADIASNGTTGITIGGIEFFFVEYVNNSSSQNIVFDADITGLDTRNNDYYVWSFLRYAFETSDTYLLVGDPVRIKKLIDCAQLSDRYVPEDGSGTYTHTGTHWDAITYELPSVTLDSARFFAVGATPETGTTLNNVVFPLGITPVKWISWMDEFSDTCEFVVTVGPESFLDCDALVDQYVQEPYTHVGKAWDIKAKAGIVLSDSSFVATGATTIPYGKTLDGVTFNLGTTFVKWYGINSGDNSKDSCEFTVTVNPEQFMNCSLLSTTYYLQEDSLGFYTHHTALWNAMAHATVGLDTLYYVATGAMPATGTSLDTVKFPLGATKVTWYGIDLGGYMDSCEMVVMVYPRNFLNCGALTDRDAVETGSTGYYTHTGTGWDITPIGGVTLNSKYYTATGALPATGNTLNTAQFPLGTTTVKWYGTIANPGGGADFIDSCEFDVLVLPSDLVNCPSNPNKIARENAPVGFYTHTGTLWDVTPRTGITLTARKYVVTGTAILPVPPTTLNGAQFPLGVTDLKYIVEAQYTLLNGSTRTLYDTCEFTVTVLPESFLDCDALVDQYLQEPYTHTGYGWDVKALPGIVLSDSSYVTTGATVSSGTTLNGVTFNLGTTYVKWYATSAADGLVDSCEFTVTVNPEHFMNCSLLNTHYYLQEDALGYYQHHGTSWNAAAISSVTLDTLYYVATGTLPATGTSLDTVKFPLGTTHVKWYGVDLGGYIDSCEIDVTIYPRNFLNCGALADRDAVETGTTGYYTHTGSGWDITPIAGITLKSKYYTATGALPATGNTLNTVQFPVGTTTVKWYGTIANPGGGADFIDSCEFDVTVVPSKLVNCPSNSNKTAMESTPAGFYTHTGILWDITTRAGITLTASKYVVTGTAILPVPPITLNGAQFPLGVTDLKYIVEAQYTLPDGSTRTLYDTCEFRVTITPLSLLNCAASAMSNKQVYESAPMHGYDHVGTSWDAVVDPAATAAGLTITRSYKITIAGTTYTGASLNGFNFPVGITLVKWYGTDQFGRLDSCQYNVTIDALPIAVLDCSDLQNQAVISDFEGANVYTQHGTAWDAKPGDPVLTTLTELTYRLTGATTGTGAWTLDGVAFKLGKTTVTWFGKDQYGFVDSCKFTVTVIMNCPASVAYEGGPYRITSLAGLCWTDNMANKNYDGGGSIAFAQPYTCPTCPAQLDTIFGLLYTWYSAVNVPEGSTTLPVPGANGHVQGICPNGFHVPSQAELNLLHLYPVEDLKSTNYWIVPGTNATGFNALPAGKFNGATNRFEDMYGFTGWWTSLSGTDLTAFYNFINYYCQDITTQEILKSDGLSVRCIMDY